MKFIAYTTKGLEFVSENEIKNKLSNIKILEARDKRIVFESNSNFDQLARLKTVDDIGILISTLTKNIDLKTLAAEVEKINFDGIKNILSNFRKIRTADFSITTSLVGIKNFFSSDLIIVISQAIKQKYRWNFTEFDHTNFDIRVFIDHTQGYISIRITKESLQHRPYKISSKEGSLKPTIAAAMICLATDRKTGLKIIDNFCGSGTILAEGLSEGFDVYGGDIDPKSVLITKNNLSNLNGKTIDHINLLNALSTKWPNKYFDCAVSNLPWGKQIEIKSITKLYEDSIREYARILKPNGVLCTLISQPDLFIKYVKKYFPEKKINQFKIGLLGQTPTIILAR